MKNQKPIFIIGAQKAGTTSLYHYLSQIPGVVCSDKKELHFFDFQFHKGKSMYASMFNSKTLDNCMDASPLYLFHPEVPYRVKQYFYNPKIVVLLRNPVERAYSHYQMNRDRGIEPLDFGDALLAESMRLRRPEINKPESHFQNYSYLQRGKYFQQLLPWLRLFGRPNIFVIESNYFFKNTKETLLDLCQFLQLDAGGLSVDWSAKNTGTYTTFEIHDWEKSFLENYYKSHNQILTQNIKPNVGQFNW